MSAPVLTTATARGDALTLRPLEPRDAAAIVAMMSEDRVRCWLAQLPDPYLPEHADRWIAAAGRAWQGPRTGRRLPLVVELAGRAVGQVAVRPGGRSGQLCFALAPEHWGRGIMTAALRAFAAWALSPEGLDLVSLHWRARRGNWAGRRVAWAAGFAFDGTSRGALVDPDGTPVDLWQGSLLRGEPLTPRHHWHHTPTITVGQLLLREPRDQDASRIVEACSDPQTARWLPELPSPYGSEDAHIYLGATREEQSSGTSLVWSVTDVDRPEELLGMVALSGLSVRAPTCEVGYWVHPQARRRSVATIACRAATRHALLPADEGGLGLHAVLLRAAEDNEASQRVAVAAGFTRTGVDPRAQRRRGGELADFIRFHFTLEQLEAAWAHPSSLC